MGGSLLASVFSSFTVCFFTGWFVIFTIFTIVFPYKCLLSRLGISSALYCVLYLMGTSNFFQADLALNQVFKFYLLPGNSLRPVRALAPYILALAFLYSPKVTNNNFKFIFFAVSVSFVSLWSNDFAVPTIICYSLLSIFLLGKDKLFPLKIISYFLLLFINSYLLLLLSTKGNVFHVLRYNFHDVLHDQFWYYAPYADFYRFFGLFDIPKFTNMTNIYSIILYLYIGIYCIRFKSLNFLILFVLGTNLLIGALLAMAGGHVTSDYLTPFYFWLNFTILFLLIQKINAFRNNALNIDKIFSVLVFIIVLICLKKTILNYKAKIHLLKFSEYEYVPELGGYIGKEWKNYLHFARENKDKKLNEEYYGIWSALNNKVSSWPVDSIIHALGDVRNHVKALVPSAELITTTKYSASYGWQPWNFVENYWFYDELIRNWSPILTSPMTIVWEKNEKERIFPAFTCKVDLADATGFSIVTHKTGYYKVTLDYISKVSKRSLHNVFKRGLILLKTGIPTADSGSGKYVSIDPKSNRIMFPVFVRSNEKNPVFNSFVGGADMSFKIVSCKANFISFSDPEVLPNLNFLNN